jgi:hypothetical protein
MLSDVMRILLNVLLPLLLLIAWIIAEFRSRLGVRVGLGLICFIFPMLWVGAVIYTTEFLNDIHHFTFRRIERLVRDGHENKVLKSLQVYEKTFSDTGSQKAAVLRMNEVLLDNTEDED